MQQTNAKTKKQRQGKTKAQITELSNVSFQPIKLKDAEIFSIIDSINGVKALSFKLSHKAGSLTSLEDRLFYIIDFVGGIQVTAHSTILGKQVTYMERVLPDVSTFVKWLSGQTRESLKFTTNSENHTTSIPDSFYALCHSRIKEGLYRRLTSLKLRFK